MEVNPFADGSWFLILAGALAAAFLIPNATPLLLLLM